MLELRHDPNADAVYIRFADGEFARAEDVGGERRVDYATDGTVLGVEILYPSDGVDVAGLPRADEITELVAGHGLRVATAADITRARTEALAADPSWERAALARAVARALGAHRQTHGLGIRDLARKLGMPPANVVRLLEGEHNPSVPTLRRLSRLLGLRFVVQITDGSRYAIPEGFHVLEDVTARDGTRVLVASA